MNGSPLRSGMNISAILLLCIACMAIPSLAQRPQPRPHPTGPWMNTSLTPDERADLVIKEMTVDEKIALLHGVGMPTDEPVTPENAASNRGVGYAVGVPRLGIPGIDMSDAAYGVRSSGVNGRYSTALAGRRGRGRKLGHRCSLRVRRTHRPRTARTGIQHVARRRRESYPRSAQRPHL